MKLVRYVCALFLVALAACGGGGGSGGGGGGDLSIGAVTPSTVTATFPNKTQGGASREVALTAAFSGTTTGTIFVIVEDPDAVFTYAEVQIDSASSATLHLFVDENAAVGQYDKPMILHVCRDAACAGEFEGSPRTIQKHVTIEGTTLSTSALSFASTVGMPAASQAVEVTAPGGAEFDYEAGSVDHTWPDGSTNSMSIDEVFSITKTSGGLLVRPRGLWAGHYAGWFRVKTTGYADALVELDYQVDAAATPVVTPLTSSVSGSGQAGSTDDIPVYVEYVHVMEQDPNGGEIAIDVNATGGSPDTHTTRWLRYYDLSFFTHGDGPPGNAYRLRFFLNPCISGIDCLAPGTYTADISVTVMAFEEETTFTVPATFTVNP